jgi:hypothetical protein
MRYFHKTLNQFHCPSINVDKLWSLVPAEQKSQVNMSYPTVARMKQRLSVLWLHFTTMVVSLCALAYILIYHSTLLIVFFSHSTIPNLLVALYLLC